MSDNDHFYVRDVTRLPVARPGLRLPAGVEILLPTLFHEKTGSFNMWCTVKLNEQEALSWSLWLTIMETTHRTARELVPYMQRLQPTRDGRLGSLFRIGFGKKEQQT